MRAHLVAWARPVALPLFIALALALPGCSFTGSTAAPPTPVGSRPSYGVPPTAPMAPPAPGNARFDRPGYALTFDYPSRLQPRTDVSYSRTANGSPNDMVAFVLDANNAIVVDRRVLDGSVTDANLDHVEPKADSAASEVAGTAVHGTEVEVAGLPGLEYRISINSVPPNQSRYVIAFDGATEYTLDCQSTADHRAEIDAACQTAVATLHHR